MKTIKPGDVVKWRKPNADESEDDRYVIREVLPASETACLPASVVMQYVCDLALPPTTTALLSEVQATGLTVTPAEDDEGQLCYEWHNANGTSGYARTLADAVNDAATCAA